MKYMSAKQHSESYPHKSCQHFKYRRTYVTTSDMEAAARKGVFVCSTIKGLLPALRKAMPSVSFVEIPSDDLRKGSKATEHWNRDGMGRMDM